MKNIEEEIDTKEIDITQNEEIDCHLDHDLEIEMVIQLSALNINLSVLNIKSRVTCWR